MHLAPLIRDLAVILSLAAVVTLLFRLLKQPVVLGYIVAGIVVGPYTPPLFSVVDSESVHIWAEIGVIFLMFALGLEFSLSRLKRVGMSSIITGCFQIGSMIGLGYLYGSVTGWDHMNAIFLGCMIAISSTTIIIKTFEELGVKGEQFAELVIGILIVEDLAAIIMLVGLGNLAMMSSVSGLSLLKTSLMLALVVGTWLVIGMFIVPRITKLIRRRGTSELLVVTSIGLCFSLVTISSNLGYSVALGAFIMGSILCETNDGKRIETLVTPLKDIFGAVFFVSVGMLLDPSVIIREWQSILGISILVIVGKIFAVWIGSIATGQSLRLATQSALSMAQIGELSFVIATLGLSLNVIDKSLYPVIVSVSIITTFTTPYLLRSSEKVIVRLNHVIPRGILAWMTSYELGFKHRHKGHLAVDNVTILWSRWISCLILVTVLFLTSSRWLLQWLDRYFSTQESQREHLVAWAITFGLSSPFIWGMLTAVNRTRTASSRIPQEESDPQLSAKVNIATAANYAFVITLLGVLSIEFIAVWISLTATVTLALTMFLLFRHRLEMYFHWFETTFVEGLKNSDKEPEQPDDHSEDQSASFGILNIKVPKRSELTGMTLLEACQFESNQCVIVALERKGEVLYKPHLELVLKSGDVLSVAGPSDALTTLKSSIEYSRSDLPII